MLKRFRGWLWRQTKGAGLYLGLVFSLSLLIGLFVYSAQSSKLSIDSVIAVTGVGITIGLVYGHKKTAAMSFRDYWLRFFFSIGILCLSVPFLAAIVYTMFQGIDAASPEHYMLLDPQNPPPFIVFVFLNAGGFGLGFFVAIDQGSPPDPIRRPRPRRRVKVIFLQWRRRLGRLRGKRIGERR